MMTSQRIITALLVSTGLGALSIPATARSPISSSSQSSSQSSLMAGVRTAIEAALTVKASRVEILAVDPPTADCQLASPFGRGDMGFEVPSAVEGSGRVAVKLTGVRAGGAECHLWLWARVRITAEVPIARRVIRAGDSLAEAVTFEVREIHPGHSPAAICEGCVADRFVGAGQVVESAAVRAPGLQSGEPVKVVLVSGSLLAEQNGRAISCGRGQCAVLPSGKHVQGTLVDGRLMVRVP